MLHHPVFQHPGDSSTSFFPPFSSSSGYSLEYKFIDIRFSVTHIPINVNLHLCFGIIHLFISVLGPIFIIYPAIFIISYALSDHSDFRTDVAKLCILDHKLCTSLFIATPDHSRGSSSEGMCFGKRIVVLCHRICASKAGQLSHS